MSLITVLAIVTLGLVIPFLLLKFGFKTAHHINPDEKETLELKDLPKDQKQVARQ